MVDSNSQIVPPDIEQDDIPYMQRSNMTEDSSTPVEEESGSSRGVYEWLKLIIFVGAILLVSYLTISVISPILFQDYVPSIMGLDRVTNSASETNEPIEAEPAEESDVSNTDAAETNEGVEAVDQPAVEATQEQETVEAEPLPTEENEAAKTETESQTEHQLEITTYIVERGETLTSIAEEYNITVEELVALNELVNPNFVYAGQEINVPK
ncbi:MAG: LysM peptidoglycan-binding domain-containing protein [Chloroflexota bacterium]